MTGLSEFAYGKLLHLTAALGAFGNVENTPRQQLAPGQTTRTGPVGRLRPGFGLVSISQHDSGPVASAGCQDAVISYQVEPWGRYESSQFLE